MTADIKSDMQDVLYGAMLHDRYDTSEQALDALMPHVDRYVAAELRRLAEAYEFTHGVRPHELETRAAELEGGGQ